MAKKLLIDAVEARLKGNWQGAPVADLNGRVGVTPKDRSAYVLIQYPYNTARQLTFGAPGANVWREEGGIRFLIHVARASGVEQGFEWADEIAALFRGKEFDGVQTFAPSSPVIDDANENGNYFVLSFAVPYQFDLIG